MPSVRFLAFFPPARATAHAACLLAAAAMLAGCTGPRLPPLPDAVPAAWHNADPAPGPRPDPMAWWKTYDDPLLDQLVEQALADNLDVAQAQARLQAARRLHSVAQAPYRPGLSFSTRDAVSADASSSYFQVGFDATWELGLFGRSEAAGRLARADVDTSAAHVQAARVSVAAEVVRSYRELRNAQQRSALLQQAVALQERQAELLEVRVRARLASPFDLDRAQASLEQARAAATEPAQEVRAGAQELALLLGRDQPDPSWLQATASSRPPERAVIASAPADILRARPDVQVAQARVLEAAGQFGIAYADLFPRLGLGGAFTVATNFANNFEHVNRSSTQTIFSLGPLIDIPLFDWGQRRATEGARGQELRAALLNYRQKVLTGLAEAETALIQLDQTRQQREAQQRALDALDRAAGHARQLAALRLSSEFDNADLATRRVQAELALAATTLQQDLAFIALYKAVGGAPAWQEATPVAAGD